jgi:hypothetical protein
MPRGFRIGHPRSRRLTADPASYAFTPSPVTLTAGGGFSWPDATNTGYVPTGVTLTLHNSSFTTSSNGQVIDSLDIVGQVKINHNNVTLKRCRVRGSGSWAWAGVSSDVTPTGFLMEDCEVDGGNRLGIYGIGMGGGTIRRCNVYGVENGINPQSDCVYTRNWVHNLTPSGADPHTDACPMQGGNVNVTVSENTLDAQGATGYNSHFFINSYFGNSSNIVIDGNLLIGTPAAAQGFNFYSYRQNAWGTLSGVYIRNNRIVPAPWGVFNTNPEAGATVVLTEWSNNVNHNTGATIPSPI